MAILATVVILTILVSSQCSLYEATLLSTRVSSLEASLRKGRHKKLAGRMIEMKHEIAIPIAAILILNTIANTAGATIAGMYAHRIFGSSWVLLFSILFTLAILFVAEIVPKTIGAMHWRTIWPFIVHPLKVMTYVSYPLIAVTLRVTNWLSPHRKGPPITEDEILSSIQLGAKSGEISRWEGKVVHNIFQLEETSVSEVMTPRSVIFSVSEESTASEALAAAGRAGFTRVPVYRDDKENIVGYVVLSDIAASAIGSERDRDLSRVVKPIQSVEPDSNCLATLTSFLRMRHHIATVEDAHGGIAGLITLEDLLETLLGSEIVDERDVEVDMRKLARRKRRERRKANRPESSD